MRASDDPDAWYRRLMPRTPPHTAARHRLLPAWAKRADESVNRRVNRRHAPDPVDRALLQLSRSADRGGLWVALAGVFALTGHRRAAARGVLSLAAATILANLVGKQVFGGDRPLLRDVPLPRRLPNSPTSGSFPSGHAASAAAFATGVAIESPKLGAALTPLAGAVAYSRIHVGAHWLSDVVGGVLLGTAVALVGRIVAPKAPRVPRARRNARSDLIRLPANPTGERVFIVMNRASGRGAGGPDPAAVIAKRLPRAEVRALEPGGDAARIVRRRMRGWRPPQVIGVCGGDGTIAAVAHEARRAGVPLLVVPGGTFNHFAQTAGIESADAAIDALRDGTGLDVDVAELSRGRHRPVTVLNTASVGLYPEFVAERERRERRMGKRAAALVSAARILRGSKPVIVDTGRGRAPVWSVFVGVNRYYPASMAPVRRRRLNDGVLDVRILHAGRRRRARALLGLGLGHRTASTLARLGVFGRGPLTESLRTEQLSLTVRTADGGVPGFAHDGEVHAGNDRRPGTEPTVWRMRIVPKGLQVYAPGPKRPRLTGR